jgi:hypothetical protein
MQAADAVDCSNSTISTPMPETTVEPDRRWIAERQWRQLHPLATPNGPLKRAEPAELCEERCLLELRDDP